MRYDFAVIGANGMQGRIVARDLLESGYSVLLCANDDFRLDALIEHKRSDFALIDLREMARVRRVLKKSGAKVVVNCAIDDFNLEVTKACLEVGAHYVDLGSWEDMVFSQLALHPAFKEKGLTALVGAGSTPGVTNVMLRHLHPKFDTIHTVHVGFAWNSNMPRFVPPFSLDAIAYEFASPAKILENGAYRERAPQECPFTYEYRGIGKQTTWYTDHMEHFTFHEFLKEKGIQNIAVCSSFPDHSRETILKLMELGFTKYTGTAEKYMVDIKGVSIEPIDFTEMLLRRIIVPTGYEEKETLWLKVWGTKNGKEKYAEMDACAATLPGWEEHTCNVDTGMPASIMAQMLFTEMVADRGVLSPEFVIPPALFFAELGRRNIVVYENGRKINGPAASGVVLSAHALARVGGITGG